MPSLPRLKRRPPGVDEFDLIKRLLAPLAAATPGTFDLTNDAAIISPPVGQDLVVTKDMVAAGIHFLPDDPPNLIARKLLRVNLSDLAAMGASPLGYLVGAAFSEPLDEDWLIQFVDGLAADQEDFGLGLMGGDTIAVGDGPLVLSLTALGVVPQGGALTRSGAVPGNLLAVSGTLGDGALGLRCLRGEIAADPDDHDYLVDRYRLPRPRLELGSALIGRATAALDISDGLAADAGHLSEQSNVAIRIDVDSLPLSGAARRLVDGDPAYLDSVLTGGDDYELLFTIGEADLADVRDTDAGVRVIGMVEAGSGVWIVDADGHDITPTKTGWRHGKSAG
ncbi:MAG: thiamine-phosphate kinase [Pseudomonadota bacterium]